MPPKKGWVGAMEDPNARHRNPKPTAAVVAATAAWAAQYGDRPMSLAVKPCRPDTGATRAAGDTAASRPPPAAAPPAARPFCNHQPPGKQPAHRLARPAAEGAGGRRAVARGAGGAEQAAAAVRIAATRRGQLSRRNTNRQMAHLAAKKQTQVPYPYPYPYPTPTSTSTP
jgi:hypothetical protein